MSVVARLSHVAFLVRSADKASAVPSQLGFHIGPAEKWEGEGTLEIYVGEPLFNGRLLLMEPASDGAYLRALQKRGPGLHHIAIDVLNLEAYVTSLSGSGWLLHPKSLLTIGTMKTAYLARPGIPTLIEVQERDSLSDAPLFISKFELPFAVEQMRLISALGVEQLTKSPDADYWLTCGDHRFSATLLWTS